MVAEKTSIKDALEAAIAKGTAAKVEIVHMERPVKTVRGEVIGTLCRGVGRGRGSITTKTKDPAKATCKRCRTALGLPSV